MGSTVPLWVVLLVGLASPLASFGTAWITVYLSNKREWRRFKHESDLKEAEFQDLRRKELRDERRKAYRRMHDITRTINPTKPYEFDDLSEAFSEIQLLTNSPAVLSSAWSLFSKANEARTLGRNAYLGGIKDVANHPPTRASFQASQSLREGFLNAAREELELPPLPSLEQAMIPAPIVFSETPENQHRARSKRPWWRRVFRG